MVDVQHKFVLASNSSIRRSLLESADFQFLVDPADIDERSIESEFTDPAALAARLAEEKALVVSRRRPGALVLGSDQVFTLNGSFVAKPTNRQELRAKLQSLSGETHEFHCGFALARDGKTLHVEVDRVQVTFYDLSEGEIDDYTHSGEGIGCAGGYRFEEGGVRLIREVMGSHFTVLGLPMLPLVKWLRENGEMATVRRVGGREE